MSTTNADRMDHACVQAAELLLRHPACLIISHAGPDADAIGATLALYWALRGRRKAVSCYNMHRVPEECRFLPGATAFEHVLPATLPPLVVMVDANRLKRCGVEPVQLPNPCTVLRIDHHDDDPLQEVPMARLVRAEAAATCEIVSALLPHLDVPLSRRIATCLLAGLASDTHSFQTTTTPPVLRLAADLQDAGAHYGAITRNLFHRKRPQAVHLLGAALSNLRFLCDQQVAYTFLTKELFTQYHALPERDTDGIINYLRDIRGVKVAILLTEKETEKERKKETVVHVSFRSREINVAELARTFGGGGHAHAAGARIPRPLHAVMHQVLDAVEARLNVP